MTRSAISDPVLLAQQQHPAAAALPPEAIEFCFQVMGSRRTFFDEMRQHIQPNYFTAAESVFAVLWESMCGLADAVAGNFTYQTLSLAVRDYYQLRQIPLSAEAWAAYFDPSPRGIIWSMTTMSVANEHVTYARLVLRRFLQERTVVSPLRRILQVQETPQNIDAILGTVRDHSAKIAGLNEIPRVDIAPLRGTVEYSRPVTYKRTGVDWIDHESALGGQIAGDCCGIIAPTGGGKTTLAVHMAVTGARACWDDGLATNTVPEFVVYVSVEESGKKLQPRVLSAACRIPLQRLRTLRGWDQLSTPETLQPYEHSLGQDPGGNARVLSCERDRYDAAQPILARCFDMLDFSGSEEFPNSGRGYVQEVTAAISHLQQKRGQGIRAVYIDYAGLLVERSMGQSLDDRKLRLWLKRIGDDFRGQVAERFGCTCWVLHQLRGEAGNSSPLKLMKHTDAGETKDFANNMAICGCMGAVDTLTGCRRLNWSKTRNVRNEAVTPVTLRINDEFAMMDNVTNQYIADEASRRFVTRNEAAQIMGQRANDAPPTPPMPPRQSAAALTQAAYRPTQPQALSQ